jgi:probable F420-dependent oxidoreductase
MAHPRRFRFAVQIDRASDRSSYLELVRKAEDLGYDTLVLEDHFDENFAPIPAMLAAASATSSLRVSTHVFCNDYKHPLVLAKEIATLDVLTDGRVEFGLGAGWKNTDYAMSGIPKEAASTRIARLEEAVTIIKGLWGPDPVTQAGSHYQVTAAVGYPPPVQQPHPPILLGGGGRKMLSLAGRHADIVGIAPAAVTGEIDAESARTATPAATDAKLEWIRAAAGDRFDDLELNVLLFAAIIGPDRQANAEAVAAAFEMPVEDTLGSPHLCFGSVEEICDDLQARRERWGLSYVTFPGDALDAAAPIVQRLTGT